MICEWHVNVYTKNGESYQKQKAAVLGRISVQTLREINQSINTSVLGFF